MPTTKWVNTYRPDGRGFSRRTAIIKRSSGSGLNWPNTLPTTAPQQDSFTIDAGLSRRIWANFTPEQSASHWSRLTRSADQKTLFNLVMPMFSIDSTRRSIDTDDAEKNMRDHCIKLLESNTMRNLGMHRFTLTPDSPEKLYDELKALPGKGKDQGYYFKDETGNLLIILPSNLSEDTLKPSKMSKRVPPEIMYTAHMDTVPPFKKDVKPVVWIDRNGYLIVEAGKDTILGADCKAAIGMFFMDIAKKLYTKEKHPTLFYLLTVDEEGNFRGSKGFDKRWIGNNERNINLLIAFDHAGMPAIEVYNESPYLERISIGLKPKEDLAPLPALIMPETLEINLTGESAHATTMAKGGKGRSAINTLAISLDKLLDKFYSRGEYEGQPNPYPGVRVEIQHFIGGGDAHSSVAKNAKATVVFDIDPQINKFDTAARETAMQNILKATQDLRQTITDVCKQKDMPKNAIQILDYGLAPMFGPIAPEPPIKNNLERAKENAVNTVAVITLANTPQGFIEETKQTNNQVAYAHRLTGELQIGYDLRGREPEVGAVRKQIAHALQKAQELAPGVEFNTVEHSKAPEVATPKDIYLTALFRSICQRMLEWAKPPQLERTFGLSDLTYLAEPLKQFPNTGAFEQSIGYRNHHIPGTGKRVLDIYDRLKQQTFSTGEYMHLGETLVAFDLLQRLSKRFAISRDKLFKPQNTVETNAFKQVSGPRQ